MEKYISILRDLIQFESVNDGEEEVEFFVVKVFNLFRCSFHHASLLATFVKSTASVAVARGMMNHIGLIAAAPCKDCGDTHKKSKSDDG